MISVRLKLKSRLKSKPEGMGDRPVREGCCGYVTILHTQWSNLISHYDSQPYHLLPYI